MKPRGVGKARMPSGSHLGPAQRLALDRDGVRAVQQPVHEINVLQNDKTALHATCLVIYATQNDKNVDSVKICRLHCL